MTPSTPALQVVDPGPLALVQDAGRPDLATIGVARAGAADPAALEIANLLLGNHPAFAAVEIAFGATVRAIRTLTVALAGADLGAHVVESGRPVEPGTSLVLPEGANLQLAGASPGHGPGCRAYLALPGGLAVPEVLGSRSTDLRAGFGGLAGRPLRAGDVLAATSPTLVRPPARWPGRQGQARTVFRVLPGPHAAAAGPDTLVVLARTAWTVGEASDRIGLRLDGSPMPGAAGGELASLGVAPGAIQLPPDGRPIVLGVDCQPTGGYPVIAVVATVDRAALGQLAPGDRVRFEIIGRDDAIAALRAARDEMDRASASLREASAWDDLWHGAGG